MRTAASELNRGAAHARERKQTLPDAFLSNNLVGESICYYSKTPQYRTRNFAQKHARNGGEGGRRTGGEGCMPSAFWMRWCPSFCRRRLFFAHFNKDYVTGWAGLAGFWCRDGERRRRFPAQAGGRCQSSHIIIIFCFAARMNDVLRVGSFRSERALCRGYVQSNDKPAVEPMKTTKATMVVYANIQKENKARLLLTGSKHLFVIFFFQNF